MSAATPEQEPSIEEILASIRQIISDDDEGAPAAAAAPDPVPEPEPEPEPEAEPELPREDVLDLQDPLPEEEKPVIDMVEETKAPSAPIPEPEPVVEDEPEPVIMTPPSVPEASILGDHAKEAAMSAFTKLASNIALERHRTAPGVTIEDLVRDMLQPMLREWLDDNLPGIIERLVRKELEKLAQQAMDE